RAALLGAGPRRPRPDHRRKIRSATAADSFAAARLASGYHPLPPGRRHCVARTPQSPARVTAQHTHDPTVAIGRGSDMSRQLTLPAPAKLNLFLHITGRRGDGYHLL